MAKLEIEQSKQAKALYAQLNAEEKALVRSVLSTIDNAPLMPEQSLLIELSVLETLLKAVAEGERVAAVIGDADAYAERAIREIGEEVRRDRHIGALMGGIALCAIVLLVLGIWGIVRGQSDGQAPLDCLATLNIGHVICFIAILAGTRFFVIGDKRPDYNDVKKARNRTQLVGFLFIVGFLALVAAVFVDQPVVLTLPALYLVIAALVLLLLWKLSGKL